MAIMKKTKPKRASVQTSLINEITALGKKVDERFNHMEGQLESTALSFKEYVDSRISQVEHKMDRRFEQVDQRFNQIDQRFSQMDGRFDTLGKKLDTNTAGLAQLIETRVGEIIGLEDRVKILETKV